MPGEPRRRSGDRRAEAGSPPCGEGRHPVGQLNANPGPHHERRAAIDRRNHPPGEPRFRGKSGSLAKPESHRCVQRILGVCCRDDRWHHYG